MSQDNLTPEQRRAKNMERLSRFADAPMPATDLEEILIAAGAGIPAELFDSIMAEIYAEDAGTSAVPPKAATE